MKYLLSRQNRAVLKRLSSQNSLIALDFDGTLARVVRKPACAEISSKTLQLLSHLKDYFSVAIISGRSVSDLKEKLPIPSVLLVGNHGIEGLPGSRFDLNKSRQLCVKWKSQLHKKLQDLLLKENIEIEDKTYSLTVHYRNAIHLNDSKQKISDCIRTLKPLPKMVPAKCAFNILPPDSQNKGNAILKLMEHCQAQSSLYIGDDDTDEDVFNLMNPKIITIRVGKSGHSRAEFYVKKQAETNEVLKLLLSLT